MPRPGSLRLAAFAGVSIVVAALADMRAFAQTAAPPLGALRASIDDATDQARPPGQPRRPPVVRTPTRIGRVQIFGNPPASGAGTTGFDSTNTRRRPKPLPVPGQPAPQNILGPTAIPLPFGVTRSSRPGLPRLPVQTGSDADRTGPPTAANPAAPGAAPNTGTPNTGAPAPPANAATAGNPPGAASPAGATNAPASGKPAVGVTSAVANTAPSGATLPFALRKRKPATEDDPFDATGIRAESFILRPAIEATSGYDTNPGRLPAAKGSAFYTVAPELLVRSDWERHQLNADIRSSYSEYPAVSIANRPNLDAKVNGRIDVNRDTKIDLEARYLLSTDYPGSPNLPVGIAKLPVFQKPGATAGVTERFGRLEVTLKGNVDRIAFQDSLLLDGSSSSNKDRDYNQYGGQLRAAYELTPGIKPFAEIGADTRLHDLAVDRSGNMRDSQALTPKIGTTFEISRKLTGEISMGYVTRTFKDPTLIDIRGLIVDGSLVWNATGLTTVKLTGKSSEDESVLPGVSGVLRRDAGIQVDHAFRRWLIGTVKLGFGLDDYVGSSRSDQRYSASAAIAYKLTRSVQIKGELRQEWLHSNIPGFDYTATVALVGLRLQR